MLNREVHLDPLAAVFGALDPNKGENIIILLYVTTQQMHCDNICQSAGSEIHIIQLETGNSL